MQTIILSVYYTILLLASIIGATRYRRLDNALRFIAIFLGLTLVSESASYVLVELKEFGVRNAFFHIYSILQLLLVSLFFIFTIKPYHYRKLAAATILLCPLIGILNIVFFQPIDKLDTNMLMFESFIINTMSLYLLYRQVKSKKAQNIFKYPHLRIALLLLLQWSSTFFFWALVPVLDDSNWEYLKLATYIHAIINILVYSGIALVLYTQSKTSATHGYN